MIQLDSDERVIYEIRRHWFVLVSESIFLALLLFVPLLAFYLLDIFEYDFSDEYGALFAFIIAGWFLFVWISFLIVWTNYYLDVWLVTDRRIIDVEQYGLFSRNVSEFRLDRVQDVTIEIKGFLPTVLKFGDIHVQTAGEGQEFVIRRIPNPYQVKDVIVKAHSRAVENLRDSRVVH